MQTLRMSEPRRDTMPESSRDPEADGMALMEAALMASPHAAVNGPRRRKRTKYNSWQKSLLEKAYSVCKYPNVWTRETLSKALNVDDARIIVWFQNRRARYSRQTGGARGRARPAPSDDPPCDPSGTLHYPGPSYQPPCGAHDPRPCPSWHGPKQEGHFQAPACGLVQPPAPELGYWAPPPDTSPAYGSYPAHPLDGIKLDFTEADFETGLGTDFSHVL